MPLHDVLERVALSFLEIISPVQRVEPRVQEELGPVIALFATAGIAQQKAAVCEIVAVLGKDQRGLLSGEVGEGVDDAVGGDNGDVFEHKGLETLEDVRFDGERGRGDERVRREGEEPWRVWVDS